MCIMREYHIRSDNMSAEIRLLIAALKMSQILSCVCKRLRLIAIIAGPIDLSHTSAILDLKRGSVGYTVVTTQPWIWVTVVFPECKSIYRGIHLTYLSFNQIPNQEKDTTLG